MIKNKGFSILEILIATAIFFLILSAIISFLFSMNISNTKTKTDRDVSEGAKSALEKIVYEIRSAKSIYTPTTTSNQLSLETTKYLPDGEINTFVDFFLCGTGLNAICFKKESENPVVVTPNSIQISSLSFSQISTSAGHSVQVSLAADSINLTSTASLRSY